MDLVNIKNEKKRKEKERKKKRKNEKKRKEKERKKKRKEKKRKRKRKEKERKKEKKRNETRRKEKRKEKKRKEKKRKEKRKGKKRKEKRKEKKRRGRKIVSSVVHGVRVSLTFHNCIQACHTSIFLTWQHKEPCLNIPRPTKLPCSVTFRVLTCVSKHGQIVLYYYYSLYFI